MYLLELIQLTEILKTSEALIRFIEARLPYTQFTSKSNHFLLCLLASCNWL